MLFVLFFGRQVNLTSHTFCGKPKPEQGSIAWSLKLVSGIRFEEGASATNEQVELVTSSVFSFFILCFSFYFLFFYSILFYSLFLHRGTER